MTKQLRIYEQSGARLLSVTSVLSFEPQSKGLEIWRNRVGEEAFEKAMEKAALRGTAIHALAENFFLKTGKAVPTDFDLQIFVTGFYTFISREGINITDTIFLERELFNPYIGFAGTADAMFMHTGILSLFDWKTSAGTLNEDLKIKYKKQTAMYCMLWNSLYPENQVWRVVIPVFSGAKKDGYSGLIVMEKEEIIFYFRQVIPTIIIANTMQGLPVPDHNYLEELCSM